MSFDPTAVKADPFAAYLQARAEGGILQGRPPYPGVERAHYVFTHRLVTASLKHPALLQAPDGPYDDVRQALTVRPIWALLTRSLLLSDPPEHGRLRRPVTAAARPEAAARLGEIVRREAGRLVAEAARRSGADAVRDIAIPFSFFVLEQILGIDLPDPWALRIQTGRIAAALDIRTADANAEADEACSILAEVVNCGLSRQEQGGKGMAAAMLIEASAGRWSRDEVIANLVFMIFAGQETVVDAFGNALQALQNHPEERERLANGMTSPTEAVEELLRFGPPVHYSGARIAARGLDLDGHPIAAGDAVVAVLASANRDEAVFSNGERLCFAMPSPGAMAFGTGLHMCLGQHIARLELAAMLQALFAAAPGWRLDEAGVKQRPNTLFRGLTAAPLRF